ncbi:MAG: PA14 domain-containing protein [Sulfolobales archaeon]
MRSILVRIKSGRSEGLLGLYGRIADGSTPDDTIKTSLTFERVDPVVNFIWIDDPAPGIPLNSFAAMWEGYIEIPRTGKYLFFLEADDGARLYMDGSIIIDLWGNRDPRRVFSDWLELSEGPHKVRIEYYNEGSFGKIGFGWSREKGYYEIIPSRYLYTLPSRSIIVTGIPKTYKVILIAEGETREAIFKGGLALIPLGSREKPIEGIIKVFDEDNNPLYISPYIEILPGDVFSLEMV